jgi:hypothetical protein
MDIEGVWAQLCFPNFGGFAGSTLFAKDKDLARSSWQRGGTRDRSAGKDFEFS